MDRDEFNQTLIDGMRRRAERRLKPETIARLDRLYEMYVRGERVVEDTLTHSAADLSATHEYDAVVMPEWEPLGDTPTSFRLEFIDEMIQRSREGKH